MKKRLLLIGHGHSVANAILLLAQFCREQPGTEVTWATRSPNTRPVVEIADDPLPERRQVVAQANELASHPPSYLTVERRKQIQAIELAQGAYSIVLSGNRSLIVDEIIALVGYRPDLSFVSELALEISPETEGPDRLTRAIGGATDCLSLPQVNSHDLS